jgi:hypothetical protein
VVRTNGDDRTGDPAAVAVRSTAQDAGQPVADEGRSVMGQRWGRVTAELEDTDQARPDQLSTHLAAPGGQYQEAEAAMGRFHNALCQSSVRTLSWC